MGSSLEADDDTLDVGDGIFEEADGSLRNRDNRGFSKEYRGVAKNTRKNISPPLQEKYVYLQLETQQYLHYETSYTLGSRSGFLNLGVSLPDQPIRQGGLWRNL